MMRFNNKTISAVRYNGLPLKLIRYNNGVVWRAYKTAAGSVITLTDSCGDTLKMLKLYGRSSQNTLTGKNLLARDGHFALASSNMGDNSLREGNDYVSTIIDCTKYGRSFYFSSDDFKKYNSSAIRTGVSANMPEAGGYIYRTSNAASNSSITVSGDKNYLYIGEMPADTAVGLPNSMIEVGKTKTDYEPYCGGTPSPNIKYPQDISAVSGLTVYTGTAADTPLCSLSVPFSLDGIGTARDELTLYDSTGTLVHKTHRVVFDGSSDENVSVATGGSGTNTYKYIELTLPYKGKAAYTTDFLCTRMIKTDAELSANAVFINNYSKFTFGENVFGGGIDTVTQLREWLSQNPIEVVYELSEPIKETVSFDLSPLKTYEGGCSVWNSAGDDMEIGYCSAE